MYSYLERVQFPQAGVLRVAVLRFIELGQVHPAPLHVVVQHEVTLGESLHKKNLID